MNNYRNNGAVGALLDEYQKALEDFYVVFSTVTEKELKAIVDPDTKDLNCRSIKSMVAHMVYAGYAYVNYIRKHLGEVIEHEYNDTSEDTKSYINALEIMFAYNEQLFIDYPQLVLEEFNNEKKVLVAWGQRYDVEQLFEHAIVHVLRHRRQLERFLIKLRS